MLISVVFKSDLTYQWDGSTGLRTLNSMRVGMGSSDDSAEKIVSWGEVLPDLSGPDVSAATYGGGAELAIWQGDVMVKCCLNLKPEESRPFGCEMSVFQKREGGDGGENEVFCSRIGRLYGEEGTLRVGSTSFFKLEDFE